MLSQVLLKRKTVMAAPGMMREKMGKFTVSQYSRPGLRDMGLRHTVREFLWVALPKLLAGGGQVLTNLLVLRRLGADRAGVLFVCITTVLLSDALLGAAVDVGVVRLVTAQTADRTRAMEVQKAALIAKSVAFLLLAVPLFIWSDALSKALFHRPGESGLLRLVAISVFGLLALRSVQTYCQVSRNFALYGAADLLHTAAKFGGIGCLLAIGVATPQTVLTCYALGPLLVAVAFLATVSRRVLLVPFRWEAVRELVAVAKWYLGAGAAGSITSRMDLLMVSAVAGTAQAGLFSAAQVLVLGFQLLGTYLGVVFAPRIIPLWKAEQLRSVYWRFQALAGAGCLLFYVVALLGTEALMVRLLPSAFHAAKVIVLLLLPSSLMALVNFPWTVSLLLFAHPRLLMALDVLALPVLVALYYASIAGYGAVGAAVVTSCYALVKTGLMQIVALRTLSKPYEGAVVESNGTLAEEPSVIG